MALKLNTSTSIVDFLKSQKKESSFSARRKLFEEGGFEKRLGSFRGSASQNLALLKSLQQSERATPDVPTPTTATDTIQTAQQSTTPSTVGELQNQTPPTPKFDLTQLPDIKPPSAQDVLAKARGETGVQIAEQEAQISKERIQSAEPAQLENVRANFASRGLVFSGAKTAQEQLVRDTNLADQLDIDIRFAKILGGAIDRAQTEISKDIEEVIAGAREERKMEVDFLKSVGLAVNPNTGELFPTLEAGRIRLQEQQELFRQNLQLANYDLALEKFDLDVIKNENDTAFNWAKLGLDREKFEEGKDPEPFQPGQTITPDQLSPFAKSVFDGVVPVSKVTGTQWKQIGPELNAVGWTALIAEEDRQTVEVIIKGLDDVIKQWELVPNDKKGLIQGTISQSVVGRTQDSDVIAYEAKKKIVGQQLARLFETGRLSDEDRKFYQQLMPNLLMDDVEVAKASARSLTSQLRNQLVDQIHGMASGGVIGNPGGVKTVTDSSGIEWIENSDGTFTEVRK